MLAVEEALINSILRAETRIGPEGRVAHGIPVDVVRERLERAGATRLM
ncbi:MULTISPECIES: hypothetical protein [unclassified Leucobacter]|nr:MULTISPECIES: hypothetical protein [unclassified Leucobacter]MBC9926448.1 hypothetical protein [Leucobacter sp. cx-169]